MNWLDLKKKWGRYSGKETSACQEHFSDLCRLLASAWLWACLALVAPAAAADRDEWHLEYGPVLPVRFTCAVQLYAPYANASEYFAVAALPPDCGHQHPGRSFVSINGRPFSPTRTVESGLGHHPVLSILAPAQTPTEHTNIVMTVTHEITLVGRHLKRGPMTVACAALSPKERESALRQDERMDFKAPAFTAWLEQEGLRRRPDESPLTFGRRACDYVAHHLKWVYPAQMDKVSVACRFTTGECGSFSQLFVAVMRANGIPARSLVGRWVSPGNEPLALDKGQGHIKSEFYAEGIGWVPVDANFGKFGEEQANFIAMIAGDENLLVQHPRRGLMRVGLQATYVDALDGEVPGAERKTFYGTVPMRGTGDTRNE